MTNSPGVHLRYRLPVSRTHAWSIFAAALFCLVWNGLTVVLIRQVWVGHHGGQPDWIATFALIPFLAIGGWAIIFFARQIWRQLRVGPTLVEISDHPLVPGASFECFVSQSGNIYLNEFAVHLICEEETTCRQGTDIRIDRQVVLNELIYQAKDIAVETGKPLEFEADFTIPPTGMHSFQSHHNAILWKVVVRGVPGRGEPFEHPFPLVVVPFSPELETNAAAH